MTFRSTVSRPLYWLAGKILAIWSRPNVQPDVPTELLTDSEAEIC